MKRLGGIILGHFDHFWYRVSSKACQVHVLITDDRVPSMSGIVLQGFGLKAGLYGNEAFISFWFGPILEKEVKWATPYDIFHREVHQKGVNYFFRLQVHVCNTKGTGIHTVEPYKSAGESVNFNSDDNLNWMNDTCLFG